MRSIYKLQPVDLKRFWDRVDKTSGCWVWNGLRNSKGYGRFSIGETMALAHRVVWGFTNGGLQHGNFELCVLHRCDNPPCVNPDHLFLGTRLDNNRDMKFKGRARGAVGDASGRRKYPERYMGERCAGAKLTEDQVRQIREMYQFGVVGFIRLSKMFGVADPEIERIVKRKLWKHVL